MWKKIKQHPYLIWFFVFTLLTFSEYVIVNAFSWASFAGSITLYRRKEAFIKYFLYIVTAISGIGTGIIVSLFDDSLGGYIWYYAGGGILIKMIRAMEWLEFPM